RHVLLLWTDYDGYAGGAACADGGRRPPRGAALAAARPVARPPAFAYRQGVALPEMPDRPRPLTSGRVKPLAPAGVLLLSEGVRPPPTRRMAPMTTSRLAAVLA